LGEVQEMRGRRMDGVFSIAFPHFLILFNVPTGTFGTRRSGKSMNRKYTLAAILLAAPSLAQAATETLDEVVVTATRSEQALTQTLSHTTLITRQDIEAAQVADVPSLLRGLAGVEIYQSGGIGKQGSLFLRGSNSSHTLVLLDGVRINSATTGATAIDQLMLDQIERIEIVRGNVSSLYGSEAIGGVIQIFTRRGQGAPSFNGSAGAGAHGAQRASAGLGGAVEGATYSVQVSRYKLDGVSAIDSVLASNVNPDKDGYDNTSVSMNAGYAFNADHQVSAGYFESEGEARLDNSGFFANATDVHAGRSVLSKKSLESLNRFAGNWESRLSYAQGMDEYQNFLNGAHSSTLQTSNDLLTWQNRWQVGEAGALIAGLERLKQQIRSDSTAYTLTARTAQSLFAGYTGSYGAQQVQLNLRRDRYSDFGAADTWLLGYGYEVTETWRVAATASTAFKTPTFNDMHAPLAWGANPDLKPERSHSSELGVHFADKGQRFDAVYFDSTIRDLIVADTNWVMQNLSEARIDGVELAYNGQFGATGTRLTATRQHPRDALTGQPLLRRARDFFSAGFTREIGTLKVGGEWQHSGVREDVDIETFARTTLAAYDVVNLTANYALDRHFTLSARVDNLLDRNYMLAHGYNTAGRTWYLGLSYR
jgi:vitamin B12 transporter